jgi:hypothetical protein
MGLTQRTPERKYLRPDHSIDQRTFDEHGDEVGIEDQTHDEVWTDVLSLGRTFGRNIADTLLKKAIQPRRGEILVTRSERTQETSALPFRARRHERPQHALTHTEVAERVPREHERRSLQTARHDRHTRGSIHLKPQGIMTAARKLSYGGFQTNLGKEYVRLAEQEEQAAIKQREKQTRRKSQRPTDDIVF